MEKTIRILTALLITLWPSACAAKPPLSLPVPPLVSLGQKDAPDTVYTFKPGDQLKVTVPSAPELSQSITINDVGRFYMPYIGQVDAAGLSIEGLREAIETALARELLDPRVDIVLMGHPTPPESSSNCKCPPGTISQPD